MGSRFGWNIVATALGAVTSFLSIPVLINYFGTNTFGFVSQFFVIIAFLPLLEFGLIQSSINYLSSQNRQEKVYPSLLVHVILITFIVVVSFMGFHLVMNYSSGLFAIDGNSLQDNNTFEIIVCIILIRIALPIVSIIDYVNDNIERLTILTLLSNIVRNVVLVYSVVLYELSLYSYFVGYLISSVFEVFIFVLFRLTDNKLSNTHKVSPEQLFTKLFLLNAFKIWILIISWNGLMQYERLVLSTVMESSDFSIIWVISTLAASVMLVSGPLNAFTLPRLNSVKVEELTGQFEKVVFTYTLLIFIPSIFVLFYQYELFEIWLSKKISKDNLLIFTIYLIGNLIHILCGFAYFVRYRLGISKNFILCVCVMTASQIFLINTVAKTHGALGTSLVWLSFSLISFFVLSLPKLKVIDSKFNWLFKLFIPIVAIFTIFISLWRIMISIIISDLYTVFSLGVIGLLVFLIGIIKKSKYNLI